MTRNVTGERSAIMVDKKSLFFVDKPRSNTPKQKIPGVISSNEIESLRTSEVDTQRSIRINSIKFAPKYPNRNCAFLSSVESILESLKSLRTRFPRTSKKSWITEQ